MKRILRFTAPWCNPCKSLAANLGQVDANVPIEVIDIDVYPEIAEEYGVRNIPTLVMLHENTEVKRLTGSKSTKELKEWIYND
jgi:thioredoxin-like negative regulator of GroEL